MPRYQILENLLGDRLQSIEDAHFSDTDTVCPICQSATEPCIECEEEEEEYNEDWSDPSLYTGVVELLGPDNHLHIFHRSCILNWFAALKSEGKELSCPMCCVVIVTGDDIFAHVVSEITMMEVLNARIVEANRRTRELDRESDSEERVEIRQSVWEIERRQMDMIEEREALEDWVRRIDERAVDEEGFDEEEDEEAEDDDGGEDMNLETE